MKVKITKFLILEDTIDPFGYDGYCVRTVEQDLKYQEQ